VKKISAAILLIIFLGLTSCHEDPQTISENPKTVSENYQRKMSKDEMEMTVDPFNDKDKNYAIVYKEIKDY
jgi:starvation-inducible outer membrane lipoprotein